MTNTVDMDLIRQHWQESSNQLLDQRNVRPVAPDDQIQNFIENSIIDRVKPHWRCLDLGCGDGRSTLRISQAVKEIVGVDYIENYVERARAAAREQNVTNAKFSAGDACQVEKLGLGSFDAVVTIRCLINLGSWDRQSQAIRSIAGLIKSGGYYFASEGWQDGIEALSALRQQCGLGEFKSARFNLFIKRTDFERAVKEYFDIEDFLSLGFYLFMSRVFQPFFLHPSPPSHNHEINKKADELMAKAPELNGKFSELDYAGVYVLKRR